MKIVWVTNDLWYSKLFRFLFNEDVSHVGTLFSVDGIDFALDINNPYGSLYGAKYWLNKYKIIHQVELSLPHDKEAALFKICADYAVMRPYDINGYYGGMIWGLIHKFVGLPLPTENKYSNHTGGMCQEIIVPILKSQIAQESGIEPKQFDFSAITPSGTRMYMEELTKNNTLWKWTHV